MSDGINDKREILESKQDAERRLHRELYETVEMNVIPSVEEYLQKYSVLDGQGNMDGLMVPMSVAHLACELLQAGNLVLKPPSWIKHEKN